MKVECAPSKSSLLLILWFILWSSLDLAIYKRLPENPVRLIHTVDMPDKTRTPASEPDSSALSPLRSLIEHKLKIPVFQRPHDWRDKQVFEPIEDLKESREKKQPRFLGLVVLGPKENGRLTVIDSKAKSSTIQFPGRRRRVDRSGCRAA
jgi:hypothetical protein